MSNFVDLCDYPTEELLQSSEPIALDTETLGKTRATNIPIYYSWASREFGSGAGPTTTPKSYRFLSALCDAQQTKIFQNAKFDLWVLDGAGIDVQGQIEDTILMHCLLDEHHLGHHKLKV
ncbi:unnamed protein product, partial [marine sediment metagenome]